MYNRNWVLGIAIIINQHDITFATIDCGPNNLDARGVCQSINISNDSYHLVFDVRFIVSQLILPEFFNK